MERRVSTIAGACLAIIAAVWPLGVFNYLPGLNMHATSLLAAIAFLLMTMDAILQRRLRIPFEFIVPWLVIAAIAIYVAATTSAEYPRRLLLALMIFAVSVHIRPTPVQVQRWIQLTALSGIAAAAMTASAWVAGWMPTAYSLDTGATLYFAADVAGGMVSLYILLILPAALMLLPRTPWPLRVLWGLGAILIAAVVATTTAAHAHALLTPGPPRLHFQDIPLVILALTLLYSAARIWAKVKVDLEERPSSLHVMLLFVVATMAIGASISSDVPVVGYGLIAGLAASYALRSQVVEHGRAWWPLGLVIGAALLILNATVVFPDHRHDGRNYEIAAAADFADRNYEQLHRRLDFVERHAPDESRTHWWRARVLLAQDRPMRAVTEFAASLADAPQSLLPAPSKAEQEIFLIQLRDAESASRTPQAAYGYARALVAVGNSNEALSFVRLQAKPASRAIQAIDTKPFADAISFLLGNAKLAESLRKWESGELVSVLQNWGAHVVAAPEWFDTTMLPVVFAGTFGLDTSQTLVTMPGDRDLQQKPFTVEPQPTPGLDTSWTPLFGDERKWVIEWTAPTRGRGPARITGRASTWDLITYETTLTAIPEHAAVTVWVPAIMAAPVEPNDTGRD